MSALPPIADIARHGWHVRYVPIGNIAPAASPKIKRPPTHEAASHCEGGDRQSLTAFLTASLQPATAVCLLSAACCVLPSVSSLASPVALPATSLTLPLAWLTEPWIRC